MKIGFYQFNPRLGDIEHNLRKIEQALSKVKADLIVLPELCNSGYNFKSKKEALSLSEPVPKGPSVQSWVKLCKRQNFFLVAGINENDKGRLYNTAVLVGPKGYIGKYRKLQLFYDEKRFFQPGNLGLPVFKIRGVKIGILICFDWQFPELWRILALKGAQIICHPSNLVIPKLSFRALPGHALVNRLFVITPDRIGQERGLKYVGNSSIWNHRGELLVQAGRNREELRILEIDPALALSKWANSRNNLFADSRVRISEKLLK